MQRWFRRLNLELKAQPLRDSDSAGSPAKLCQRMNTYEHCIHSRTLKYISIVPKMWFPIYNSISKGTFSPCAGPQDSYQLAQHKMPRAPEKWFQSGALKRLQHFPDAFFLVVWYMLCEIAPGPLQRHLPPVMKHLHTAHKETITKRFCSKTTLHFEECQLRNLFLCVDLPISKNTFVNQTMRTIKKTLRKLRKEDARSPHWRELNITWTNVGIPQTRTYTKRFWDSRVVSNYNLRSAHLTMKKPSWTELRQQPQRSYILSWVLLQ